MNQERHQRLLLKLILGLLLLSFSFASCHRPLPVLAELPDFKFLDQSGRAVAKKDLLGKVWVADFIYTGCADVCPLLTEKMGQLQKSFEGNPAVKFVSFTVDPETDTVERLSVYAKDHGVNPTHWLFLTGSLKDLEKTIVQGFKMSMGKTAEMQLFHSNRFILVDAKDRIRGYFETDAEGMKKLKDGIGGVLHEE